MKQFVIIATLFGLNCMNVETKEAVKNELPPELEVEHVTCRVLIALKEMR